MRDSFSPTPATVTRAPGQAAAAAKKNAAAEKSPGTLTQQPRGRAGPSREIRTGPPAGRCASTGTPKSPSMPAM